MVQSLVVYNLENKLIAWYTNPSLKFFKLDDDLKLNINGQTIITLCNTPDTLIDVTDTTSGIWKLKQITGTKYEVADVEENLVRFGDFYEQEL